MKQKITLLIVLTALFIGCSPDNSSIYPEDSIVANDIIIIGGGTAPDPDPQSTAPTETDLLAGQTIYSGTVTVSTDNGQTEITYTSDGDWEIQETHMYIGEFENIPTNNPGNPRIGQFPYAGVHNAGTTSVTYIVPAIPDGECLYVAAHAVVENSVTGQNETAWGDGVPLTGNNWAMAFEVCN